MIKWYRRKRRSLALLASAAAIGTGAIVGTAGAADAAWLPTIPNPPWTSKPYIEVTHTVSPATVDKVGNVTITYTMRNVGPNNLTGVGFYDETPSVTQLANCKKATLKPNETFSCNATLKITQADLDNGRTFKANAKGYGVAHRKVPFLGLKLDQTALVCDDSPATVTALSLPAIALDKTADKEKVTAAGEVITYTFKTANTGNVALSNVTVTDPKPGLSALACTPALPATLAPGASTTCTAKYTVTRADLDSPSGAIPNTATATGTPKIGGPVKATDSVTVPVQGSSSISLTKAPDKQSVSKAGEVITYTFTAQNTGNTGLTGVTITDPMTGLSALACTPAQPATLAPGAKLACTAKYTVTQADLVRPSGVIPNTATVVGTPPTGGPVTATAKAEVKITGTPAISLTKTADKQTASAGETVTYTFKATNTGNVPLTSVTITDPLPNLSALKCNVAQPASLAPAATLTCTATYVVTRADEYVGEIVNVATVRAIDPQGKPLTATASTTVTTDTSS